VTSPLVSMLTPQDVASRLAFGQEIDDLMRSSLPWAARFSDPPISGFVVGAVALGGSGALYAGANLEFTGMPLAASVHAEQSAVTNAWLRGEREVTAIAVTATPCGHCRQFLMELGSPERLTILIPDRPPTTLAELLPAAFGPRDLGVSGGMLANGAIELSARIDDDDVLGQAALGAARASYAPYTRAHAGVALQTADGTIVTGRYAESAAYNPSLPALQSALVDLRLRRIERSSIVSAVMVEEAGRTSQLAAAESLLSSVSRANVRYIGCAQSTSGA
jgi:cytidine deaminase